MWPACWLDKHRADAAHQPTFYAFFPLHNMMYMEDTYLPRSFHKLDRSFYMKDGFESDDSEIM